MTKGYQECNVSLQKKDDLNADATNFHQPMKIHRKSWRNLMQHEQNAPKYKDHVKATLYQSSSPEYGPAVDVEAMNPCSVIVPDGC